MLILPNLLNIQTRVDGTHHTAAGGGLVYPEPLFVVTVTIPLLLRGPRGHSDGPGHEADTEQAHQGAAHRVHHGAHCGAANIDA